MLAIFDLDEQRVLAIEEYDVKPIPEADGEYALGSVPLREGFKPIEITQPDGASFTVDGNRISWLDWEFSTSLDAQEGLVLHDVRFKGRRVMHRASCAEMITIGRITIITIHSGGASRNVMWVARPSLTAGLESTCSQAKLMRAPRDSSNATTRTHQST